MIELLDQLTQTVTHYYFKVDERKITITEYFNDSGKIIDSVVESEDGFPVGEEIKKQLIKVIDELN